MPREDVIYDCIVIGGGPAGLTGAIYLARFRRSVLVIDAGQSRALLIPESHNIPGFMHGISGAAFLNRLREQAETFGVAIVGAEALSITRNENGLFLIHTIDRILFGRKVLFATGIVDKEPALVGLRSAVASSVVRYCPVCDGYEATDQRVAVLGAFDVAVKKAIYLRTYSAEVRIWPTEPTDRQRAECALREHGIAVASESALKEIAVEDNRVHARFTDETRDCVDIVYPALGCEVRSQIACALGAAQTEIGCLRVDERQQTSVSDLLAAGDVVTDLHQIAVAVGHAAIAASAIHNELPHCAR